MAAPSRSRELASFLAALRLSDLPAEAVRLLKLCVLDHFGCAIGALDTEVGRAAIRAAHLNAGGPCTVIGSVSRAGPEAAALANGTLAHALIFDDLHRQAKLHPGVAVIPAALAAAERVRANGSTLLTGVAAGYEASARTGIAIGMAAHRAAGWRATATCGSFGAAAAAASVLGADASVMHDAVAFAAAQASGNWAFAAGGGMELYLAAGTAARNGVVAATLAQCGFRGADDPLEARDGGFFTMTSAAPKPELLTRELGARLRLADTCIKMYPTCHSTQTAIDAVLNLRARHALTPERIGRIEVRAGEITRVQCGWAFEPGPPSRMIFHMGYALALALKRGKLLPADFEGESLRDPELVRIACATEVIADPELTALYEERKPCVVTLTLRDGRTLSERVDYCRGEPENPPTEAAVVTKFRDLATPHLSIGAADCIVDFALDIERRPDLRPLAAALQSAE
jgi:2-methylcitrate dehydratase PrpD